MRSSDQEHQPAHSTFASLELSGTDLGLNIAQPRDGLHPSGHGVVSKEHVPGTQVAGHREGCLEPDLPIGREPAPESVQQRHLPGIADRRPGWIEPGVKAQTNDGRVAGEIQDWERFELAGLHIADSRVRSPERSRDVGLPQSRAQPGFPQLVSDLKQQPSAGQSGLIN